MKGIICILKNYIFHQFRKVKIFKALKHAIMRNGECTVREVSFDGQNFCSITLCTHYMVTQADIAIT